MINKNGKTIKKLGICLNVLLHYGKYKKLLGYKVKIIKNDGLSQYSMLVGKIGYVCGFEFENFKKPIIVHFPKIKNEYCFAIDELVKYKEKWNELKEIIKKKFVAQGGFTSYEWNDLLNELLDKMQELE